MSSISPDQTVARLGSVVGADRIREPRGPEVAAAAVIVEPADAAEIVEIVRACEADRIALAPIGAARTLSEIRRAPAPLGVSLSRLNRTIAYEPADMTITVGAGATVGELNRAMESSRQRLPVDPRDPDSTTVGALIAAADAGPLRHSEGTVRDLLIGIRYVGGGGRLIHGGGRVVKNVAGYDLMKVMGGSFGTLGIITEATFKVRPIPEQYAVAKAGYDSASDTLAAARQLNDSLPLAHLEVLSPAASKECGCGSKFSVAAGISGSGSEIASLRNSIGRLLPGAVFLEEEEARQAYVRLRDFDFAARPLAALTPVPPAHITEALVQANAEFVAHAGCGVAKLFLTEENPDSQAAVGRWRQCAHRVRGHVRILHCNPASRSSVEYFDKPNDGALALMRRMKSAFDPAGIFNPGCFVGGI